MDPSWLFTTWQGWTVTVAAGALAGLVAQHSIPPLLRALSTRAFLHFQKRREMIRAAVDPATETKAVVMLVAAEVGSIVLKTATALYFAVGALVVVAVAAGAKASEPAESRLGVGLLALAFVFGTSVLIADARQQVRELRRVIRIGAEAEGSGSPEQS